MAEEAKKTASVQLLGGSVMKAGFMLAYVIVFLSGCSLVHDGIRTAEMAVQTGI